MTALDITALWEAEYSGLCRFLQAKLRGDWQTADDIASEAFVKAWQKRDLYRDVPGGSPKGWLYKIATNTLRDYLRLKRPFFWRPSDPVPAYTLRFDEIETRQEVEQALATLTDPQREVIIGRFYEGYREKELAAVSTYDGVKQLRKRALVNLRRALEAA